MSPLPINLAILILNDLPELLGETYGSEPFSITDKNLEEIESLLERPFQTFDGVELYESPAEKVAVLFYQIIKGHKLENGNKRTAIILTLAFLAHNAFWLSASGDELYKMALLVAESKAFDKEKEMKWLTIKFSRIMTRSLPRGDGRD